MFGCWHNESRSLHLPPCYSNRANHKVLKQIKSNRTNARGKAAELVMRTGGG